MSDEVKAFSRGFPKQTVSADGQITYDIPPENRKKMQGPTQEEMDALDLMFSYDDSTERVKNVYIQIKEGQSINCRRHYSLRGFRRVKVLWNCSGGMQIVALGSNSDKDGYLFIPNHNILSIGVDINKPDFSQMRIGDS